MVESGFSTGKIKYDDDQGRSASLIGTRLERLDMRHAVGAFFVLGLPGSTSLTAAPKSWSDSGNCTLSGYWRPFHQLVFSRDGSQSADYPYAGGNG